MNALLFCAEGFGAQQWILLVVVILLVVALIVLPMFTNKKRQKQITELHNSITIGDTVKTVGGIVGKVVAINDINAVDKEFVLETGLEGSKSTMVFDFNAIYQVMAKAGGKPVAPEKTEEKVETAEVTETVPEVTETTTADKVEEKEEK